MKTLHLFQSPRQQDSGSQGPERREDGDRGRRARDERKKRERKGEREDGEEGRANTEERGNERLRRRGQADEKARGGRIKIMSLIKVRAAPALPARLPQERARPSLWYYKVLPSRSEAGPPGPPPAASYAAGILGTALCSTSTALGPVPNLRLATSQALQDTGCLPGRYKQEGQRLRRQETASASQWLEVN